MHETSLIKFTLDAVERRAAALGIGRVSDVRIVVGELRGAVPEQMDYAFRLLSRSTAMFDGAKLDIEYRPVVLKCRECGNSFPSSLEDFAEALCPKCGSASSEIISGNELLIDSFSGE